MKRHARSAWFGLVALLTAFCLAPATLAQEEGTPVATAPVTGSITVVTVDQRGDALPGACYNLVANGVLIADVTCAGQQGVVVFGNLPADGSYYAIGEARAPQGCEGQEVPGLTLTPGDPDQTQTVTNSCGESNGVAHNQNPNGNGNGSATQPPWIGTLTVRTVDQDGNPLAGACYTLGTAPGFFATDGTCSGPDGIVVIGGFWARDGNVQLTQTAAGPGCRINDTIPPLTFSKAEPAREITVTDTCQSSTTAQAAQPVIATTDTTQTAVTEIGADLAPVATRAASASIARGGAQRG